MVGITTFMKFGILLAPKV